MLKCISVPKKIMVTLVVSMVLVVVVGSVTVAATNVALNKTYTSSVAASGTYPDTNGKELTDGVYGSTTVYSGTPWQGRLLSGSYYQTVDLGTSYSVNEMVTNFFGNGVDGIQFPASVTFSTSTDGTNFTGRGTATAGSLVGNTKKFDLKLGSAVIARYVRMIVTAISGGSWVFEDEMEVLSGSSATPSSTRTPTPSITPSFSRTPTPTVTATPTSGGVPALLKGSMFQPYLAQNWSQSQFDTELQYMKDAKISDNIMWQWTADSKGMYTYYPSGVAGFTQTNPGYDPVLASLASAKGKGMKVWLGLNWTDDWWSKEGNDYAWLQTQFGYSKQLALDLWNKYKGTYANTIAGFYLTMEVDNVNFTTQAAKDNMKNIYADTANYIHSNCSNKPVMVAPFFNSSIGMDATTYAGLWGYILATAPLDVIAMQDGVGVGHATTSNVGSWFAAMKSQITATRPSTALWSDLETLDPDYTPTDEGRIEAQIAAEKAYVVMFTSFSFNHYQSPQQGHITEYNAYKSYALSQSQP